MTQDTSPVIDFYPVDFHTDLNGKQQDWEAVVLIPFIDEVSDPENATCSSTFLYNFFFWMNGIMYAIKACTYASFSKILYTSLSKTREKNHCVILLYFDIYTEKITRCNEVCWKSIKTRWEEPQCPWTLPAV